MINTLWTLLRAATHQAEQEALDRTALLVLDQHIRDAAAGIERAKRALAVAIAQDEAEGKRLEAALTRIPDLEDRAAAALGAGREELTTEAAEAIALMEADRDAMQQQARTMFADRPAATGRCWRQPSSERTRTRSPDRTCGRGGAPAPSRGRQAERQSNRPGRGGGHVAPSA